MRFKINDANILDKGFHTVDFQRGQESNVFLFNKQYKNIYPFEKAFEKIVWVTYRKEFAPLTRPKEISVLKKGESVYSSYIDQNKV